MKQPSPILTFSLSLEEANKIFKALSNLPFSEVYELIGKLNEQANDQLSSSGTGKPSGSFMQNNSGEIDQEKK